MIAPVQSFEQHPELWQAYRNNLPRHLIGLSRYLQSDLMRTLTDTLGHDQLRLSFEPFLTLAGKQGVRLTELADWLAISKQACSQTVNQIETAGYLRRVTDPQDGRARIVQLTDKGVTLLTQGQELVGAFDERFAALIGAGKSSRLRQLLIALHRAWQLPARDLPAITHPPANVLGGFLPRISGHVTKRLMQLTIARGHPDLKMSFGQVLTLIGPQGGRIQQMARIQEVSKQAIGAVAGELESLGYIRRESDPNDARQQLLRFTDRGWQLLADSVASVAELELEVLESLGEDDLVALKQLAADLYGALHLEEEIFAADPPTLHRDLRTLARSLQRQLGAERASELALLLNLNEAAP
jgi:DNA-binding MarR family transcriptional regulator